MSFIDIQDTMNNPLKCYTDARHNGQKPNRKTVSGLLRGTWGRAASGAISLRRSGGVIVAERKWKVRKEYYSLNLCGLHSFVTVLDV